jgi:hypothetical protein
MFPVEALEIRSSISRFDKRNFGHQRIVLAFLKRIIQVSGFYVGFSFAVERRHFTEGI